MNKEQAVAFINAMNMAQPYVPPMVFNMLLNSDVARITLAIANDTATCDVRPMPSQHVNGSGLAEQIAR